jgi:peptidyl-prolyl cis-trans isomerase C
MSIGRIAVRGVAASLMVLAACAGPQERLPIVAQVGSATLDEADLVDQLPVQLQGAEALEERRKFVDKWVERELLYQEATERGLDQNARLALLLEQSRRDILVAALLDSEFDGKPSSVDDAEIQAHYDRHSDQYVRELAEMWAEHIVLRSRRDANALRRELAQGGDFAAAAAEHSVDEKTSRIGGSLGYFSVDDNPELWEISQGLTIGKLSKPVATDDGFFHIVRVLERVEAGSVKSLEQVRAEIVETLVRADYRRRLDGLIERLKEQKTVMIDDERLSRL